eukprot:CAMPEP_0194047266 /NCGR_PEP_ID=MMETSP0009_2-20130614/23719_1 /TAXON_ID=210454 /ORGANISM="Grammatophora oceanica, Strain CCMP 410" /LENGTH=253 /DNA_ID=CAMNT_0038692823 /DNA_START=118 /DNA_END=879 /DNA_ORIENTATION=+
MRSSRSRSNRRFLQASIFWISLMAFMAVTGTQGFTPSKPRTTQSSTTALSFFGKAFEADGPLGKGITVGKVQVALNAPTRTGSTSILTQLEKAASSGGNSNRALAKLANTICLSLLRKSEYWTGACSTSKWYGERDAGKAESLFNDWSNREAAKFEKEYIPGSSSSDGGEASGPSTLVVVSVLVEIQGDQTNFDGAGYSLGGTKDVLSSVASNCMVEGGDCINAVEVFWTPGDRKEVLTSRDIVLDFPEVIDL